MYEKTIYNPNKPENSTFTSRYYNLEDAIKDMENMMEFAQAGVSITITDENGNFIKGMVKE